LVLVGEKEFLVFSGHVSENHEDEAPYSGSKSGIEREFGDVHLKYPGRKRNELPNGGNETSDERGVIAVLLKKRHANRVVFFAYDETDDLPSAIIADNVVDARSDERSGESGGKRENEVHFSRSGEISRRNHDDLRRKRNETALDRHEGEYPKIRSLFDERVRMGCESVEKIDCRTENVHV
jgi:hypothetical protein